MDFPAEIGGNAFEAVGTVSSGDSTGTLITASGSANTKGSYSQLIASTAFNYEAVLCTMEYNGTQTILADIAVGAGGSENIVIPNLFNPKTDTAAQRHCSRILLPVGIKAGSRIAARCQSSLGSASLRLSMLGIAGDGIVHGGGSDVWAAVDTGNSRGVTVDPGGSANTKGSWTQLLASTSFQTRYLGLVIGNYNVISNTYDGWFIDVAIGAGGSEQIIVPDWYVTGEPGSDVVNTIMVLPAEIPAGTRIAARAQSNDNTVNRRELTVATYGVS